MRWQPPTTFDDFEVVRYLGAGGMGYVYLARDTLLDRLVAIKFVAPDASDPAARERFPLEARAVARLQHPNIVAAYRVGNIDGHPYLASEYVAGSRLDRLARPMEWQRVLSIGVGLARGLAAAHHSRVLHRDIKPKSRRPSQTAPQPTDRPHSHSQGRFERVDVDRAAPGRPGVPHVLAKRWQRAGPPEDQRGHGPRNTCWCVVGPLPIMTDAVQRFTSAVPRRKPCGQ